MRSEDSGIERVRFYGVGPRGGRWVAAALRGRGVTTLTRRLVRDESGRLGCRSDQTLEQEAAS